MKLLTHFRMPIEIRSRTSVYSMPWWPTITYVVLLLFAGTVSLAKAGGGLTGKAYSIWSDETGEVWGSRMTSPQIVYVQDGAGEKYYSLEQSAQDNGFPVQFRRTAHYEWLIPDVGVVLFRPVKGISHWRPLLTSDGRPLSLSLFTLLASNSTGILLENGTPKRNLYTIIDSSTAKIIVQVVTTSSNSTLQTNFNTDGTGAKGVLFVDENFNVMQINCGHLFAECIFKGKEARLFSAIDAGKHLTGDDPEQISIKGRTKRGVVICVYLYNQSFPTRQSYFAFVIDRNHRLSSVNLGSKLYSSVCDGHALWAAVKDNVLPIGARVKKTESLRLVRWGDGPISSVSIPFYKPHLDRLMIFKDQTEHMSVVDVKPTGAGYEVRVIMRGDNKSLRCSAPVFVRGRPAPLHSSATIAGTELWLSFCDGTIHKVDLSKLKG